MPKFIGDDFELQINPELKEGEKIHVLVTQDETTLQSNDGKKSGWRPINEQPLHKKGQGRTIHISDFLTETIGRLRLLDEQISNVDENFPKDAQVKICPGKNQDGWWNLEQLIDQVNNFKKSIMIKNILFNICWPLFYIFRLSIVLFLFLN
jgi:hypothetical protein